MRLAQIVSAIALACGSWASPTRAQDTCNPNAMGTRCDVDAPTKTKLTVDPVSGDSVWDTENRSGAEEFGSCTGVWASWRDIRSASHDELVLELTIRWGSEGGDVPAEIDSVGQLGATGATSPARVAWVGSPRLVDESWDYRYPRYAWRQSIAVDVPARLAATRIGGANPIVFALYGRSAQTTYRCGAKLPTEVSADLATLEETLSATRRH